MFCTKDLLCLVVTFLVDSAIKNIAVNLKKKENFLNTNENTSPEDHDLLCRRHSTQVRVYLLNNVCKIKLRNSYVSYLVFTGKNSTL